MVNLRIEANLQLIFRLDRNFSIDRFQFLNKKTQNFLNFFSRNWLCLKARKLKFFHDSGRWSQSTQR